MRITPATALIRRARSDALHMPIRFFAIWLTALLSSSCTTHPTTPELPTIPSKDPMDVVQVVRTSKADSFFSFCITGKDCPQLSQLSTSVAGPVSVALPQASALPVRDTTGADPKPAPVKPSATSTGAARPDNASLRRAVGLTLAFPYKSATFPMGERPLLEHWLDAKDQPGGRYLVIVHTEDSGPVSRKLAQDRGDAVSDAIHQLLPPKHLDRTSVFDPYGRQVVVVIEPVPGTSAPSAISASAAATTSSSASSPFHPTSAAPLAQPPKTVSSVSRGEGSQEKSP